MTKLKHLLFSLLLLCTTAVTAHDFCVDDIYYTIISPTKKTVKVTYRDYYYDTYSGEYSGNIVIPETVMYEDVTYNVISIGAYAFINCPDLTSVTIPKSVTNIERCAFYRTGLTTVTIPNNVTRIGGWAFQYCDKLTSATIGEGVASIGEKAFANCSSLKKVVISENIKRFYNNVFEGCTVLENITFPSGVVSDFALACIGTPWYDTWYNSQPDGVVYIGNVLHKYKGEMPYRTTIKVKEGTTTIAASAFEDCYDLVDIEIPESVTSIGEYAFERTGFYNSQPDGIIYIGNVLYKYKGEMTAGTTIKVKEGTTEIANRAFIWCKGLTNVEIPNSVTRIGEDAFNGCYNLTSVTIGNGVTEICEDAFFDCCNLVDINLPESVCEIEEFAFCNTGLRSVVIPSNIDYIPYSAFLYSSKLKSIIIPESVENITETAFNGCSPYLKVYTPSLNTTSNNGFNNVEMVIQEKVNIQGDLIFTAEKPYTLVDYAGEDSTVSLPYIYKGESYEIGKEAFYHCNLTSVTIPNSVTTIGPLAFYSCLDLASVTIPSSITSIGNNAFGSCSSLQKVTSHIPAETLFEISSYVFSNTSTCTLYVPAGAKETYAATKGWKNFTNIVEMEPAKPTGDVNGDNTVGAADVTAIVEMILNPLSATTAGDVDGDEIVDVADVTEVIANILGTNDTGTRVDAVGKDNVELSVEGDEENLNITAAATDYPFSAVQFDVYLPDGVTIAGNIITGNNSVEYREQPDGAVRVVIFSPSNSSIADEAITIALNTTALCEGTHAVEIKNVTLSAPGSTKVVANDITGNITIDVAAGIAGVASETGDANNVVYDLRGCRVTELVKERIYIKNGKKFMVK